LEDRVAGDPGGGGVHRALDALDDDLVFAVAIEVGDRAVARLCPFRQLQRDLKIIAPGRIGGDLVREGPSAAISRSLPTRLTAPSGIKTLPLLGKTLPRVSSAGTFECHRCSWDAANVVFAAQERRVEKNKTRIASNNLLVVAQRNGHEWTGGYNE
jgi:hypothetical protein